MFYVTTLFYLALAERLELRANPPLNFQNARFDRQKFCQRLNF